jgi:ABC-type transport system involved in multi-copper enzyme maturation permease subunit
MSAVPETTPAAAPLPSVAGSPWSLWRRQVAAILRLEMKKSFLGRRAVLLYLLALLPVLVMVAYAVGGLLFGAEGPLEQATQIFAWIYQIFLLRFVVFFGCVWAFTNLFRGEVLDQSLHYYFLTPVRRPVLVVGKYLAALITSIVLFGGATVVCYLLMYVPFGGRALSQHFLSGPGLSQLFAYLGVTALACLGYGALFLLIGLFFRNPILPAFAILLWEGINFLLPQLLKKLSVVHYLKSLSPVPLSEGPFALVAEPPPVLVSVGGLILLTAVILFLAGLRIRRMEIDYGGD